MSDFFHPYIFEDDFFQPMRCLCGNQLVTRHYLYFPLTSKFDAMKNIH